MKQGFVYFITNWTNEVLYVGVTSDLEKRFAEHQAKIIPGFSKKYNLNKLVYYECFPDIENAILREKQIKKWGRRKKDMLVVSVNPEWFHLHDGKMIRSLGCVRDDAGRV